MGNKFRNSTNTRYLKALFFEMTLSDKSTVVYTLKDDDHEGYPSLYKLYMEISDPTEYKFATKYLDGWEHWEMLTSCSWFKPYVERWRRELEVKIKSEALAEVIKDSHSKSRTSMSSAKFLLEKGYKDNKSQVGRPTKEKISQEAQKLLQEQDIVEEHFDRLMN